MANPKPEPSKITELKGNPGRKKVNRDEPKYTKADEAAPKMLDKIGKELWLKVMKEMRAQGVLTKCDEALLFRYCEEWSTYIRAIKELKKKKNKELMTVAKSGYMSPNPYISMKRESSRILKTLESELGFSPTSRTKVAATPTTPDNDKYKKLKEARAASLIAAQERFKKQQTKRKRKK